MWVEGGRPLHGEAAVGPAKNAVLPELAAALLTEEPVRLAAPPLGDVRAMCELLRLLGAQVAAASPPFTVTVRARGPLSAVAPPSAMARMRASVLVIGPLLARCGRAVLTEPGGCAIGARPIDLHLGALCALGATVVASGTRLELRAPRGLRGADIHLHYPSHTATENAMLAATLARGTTRIHGAAREPEVADTARLLVTMGADVRGAGGPVIVVRGRGPDALLRGADHRPVPDRIEAGTLLMAAAATGGAVRVTGVLVDHLRTPLRRLRATGARPTWARDWVALAADSGLRGADVRTLPYPGFPTDLQPPFCVLAALARGPSLVSETVFEARLGHVESLRRMGAEARLAGCHVWFRGGARLRGAPLRATDLRGGAALLLAALAAQGDSVLEGMEHVARGYVDLPGRLRQLGARIASEEDGQPPPPDLPLAATPSSDA